MKQFRTDEVVNEREAMIHEIQRLMPDFNPEGKSDEYVRAYYEVLLEKYMKKATSHDKANDQEGYDKDIEKEKDDIEKQKYERLNMRNNGEQQRKSRLHEDSADEIEKNKHARLNMRGK